MIFIQPANKWNLRDLCAARRLRLGASAKEIGLWEHMCWWFSEGSERFFFLRADRARIGYARVSREGTVAVAVIPSYQKRGYGVSLLTHLRREVRGVLFAYIERGNIASHALFTKAGYRLSNIPTVSVLVMVKYDD